MILLDSVQRNALLPWFLPERAGPLVGLHVLQTGHGAYFADRWPDPRAILADTAGNYALHGAADALDPRELAQRIAGVVEAPDAFLPVLRSICPDLKIWDRVILALRTEPVYRAPEAVTPRRLTSDDAYHVWGLSPASTWIAKTWGGPDGLAASGFAWGAFVVDRLAAVAVTFFVGRQYEEIGVVTEPVFRGRGLSGACAGALARDIRARGRTPSWTTAPENTASFRVAEKLGFQLERHDRLYVVASAIPAPPRRADA